MKTLNYLIAAAVLTLGVAVSAQAGDALLSPKAKDLANSVKKAPVSANEPNLLANRPAGTPRAWALAQSVRKVPGINQDVDLAHAPRPAMSPKNPNFESAWRQNAFQQVEVAPLK